MPGDTLSLPILVDEAHVKPRTRQDCLTNGLNSVRPCQHSWCPHHLVSEKASCVLDVAALGGLTLEEVGDVLGVTRERVRQIEHIALRKLAKRGISLRSD